MRRRVGWAVVVALALLGLAGCGDDGDEEGDGGALSKSEFIDRGDTVCRELETETDKLTEPAREADVATYLGRIVRIARQARADFADLQPPGDGEAVHRSMLDALDAAVEKVQEAREAADDGDLERASELVDEVEGVGADADEQAQDYGFEECGAE